MERETRIELATFSLGIFESIEYTGTRRSPACMQIQANQQLLSHLPLIGGFLEGISSVTSSVPLKHMVAPSRLSGGAVVSRARQRGDTSEVASRAVAS